jgi:hypothetical protein
MLNLKDRGVMGGVAGSQAEKKQAPHGRLFTYNCSRISA